MTTEEQNGFRAGLAYIDNILILEQPANNMEKHVIFINLVKTYEITIASYERTGDKRSLYSGHPDYIPDYDSHHKSWQ